ncbi:putative bifunctional diguanylate cyclase/phosphodiesterase [Sphingomonas nostoxanthinifaciens]|uniref:putative bifunctional diguanylate cyclase/phosphodiesterase n=1 Tax=Sphingomonas nostoxanthinifaciens TaxID=2872652 RepID=UPI001CC20B9B|nr:bifunctional diguanylate cyclase/phosphodiesterase [Sphingomonas nostoxanthinifaciens]UAK22984.1 bifunctional diguanylate cyclase/phosphodiesterase [Sphingomonas nostoxanthinifaciens]
MYYSRISRGACDPPRWRAAFPACAATAGSAISDLRQYYLDAIHIPAAVVVLEDSEPRLRASNAAFDRAVLGSAASPATDVLAFALQRFLTGDAEREDLLWQQPGVGGRHFRAHLSRMPEYGPHARRAMLSLVDRTAEVETARSLRAEMLHDSLTGLPNRLAFGEAIDAAIEPDEGQETFAVLALDLVRFSRINESIGSLAGDELIITVARRLVSALREGDMLARIAGNEFGVLMKLVDGPGDALHAARRLQATLATPVRLNQLDIRVDCAVGCAMLNDRAPTSADIVRNAQVALKRAKKTGRVEVYQPEQINQARRRFSLETDLRSAIDNGDLRLVFQPLVCLESNAVSGFEALARWTHPEHGEIAPTEFISVAEDCGLIVPLGRWALGAAARTVAQWDAAAGRRLPVRVAVNVSAVQLARDSLTDAVASAIDAAGIGGDRLTLELTESSIVDDPDGANRVLSALHEQGCRVAMDDFGTGFSSLASLQKLPIDILKIDRSFVADMRTNRDSVAIIRAVLGLAQALAMSTIAEGIEDAETARTLAMLGCTTGQGYHFARPLAADAALAHLLASTA